MEEWTGMHAIIYRKCRWFLRWFAEANERQKFPFSNQKEATLYGEAAAAEQTLGCVLPAAGAEVPSLAK